MSINYKIISLGLGLVVFSVMALLSSDDNIENDTSHDVITKIIDGDTIYTNNHKIRLSLTDTPERGEPGWGEATEFTSKMCPVGSIVTIDQDDLQPYDRYDRMVAKVTCMGQLLNAELLYQKHAVISTSYCKTSEFAGEFWAVDHGC